MNNLKEVWLWLIKHWRLHLIFFVALSIITYFLMVLAIPNYPVMVIVSHIITVLICVELILLILMPIITITIARHNFTSGLKTLYVYLLSAVLWLVLIALAGINNPDPYAYFHPIPEGLSYELPSDDGKCPEILESDSTTWLQVSTEYLGLYDYTFFYPNLPKGDIFLRCFEAGTNEPLSAKKIESSTIVSSIADTSFCCQVNKRSFIIYEGYALQYYVARIEVWFRDSLTHKESKLIEKFYRVDGFEH